MNLVDEKNKWVFTADSDDLRGFLRMGWITPEGILWHEELAGISGMSFILFPAEHHTKADIEAAKEFLRTSRDVVGIQVGKAVGKYPLPPKVPVWTPVQREAGFRKVLERKTADLVESVMVDLFSASLVVQIMDGLSPESKERYLEFPAEKMIDMAYKINEKLSNK